MRILGAAPFAACGFIRYHGMTAEQLVWAWIKSEILTPKWLVFKSDCLYHQIMQPAIEAGTRHKPAGKKKGKKRMKKSKRNSKEGNAQEEGQ